MRNDFKFYFIIPLVIGTLEVFAEPVFYFVKKGDSLSTILYSNGYKQIYGANGVLNKFAQINKIPRRKADYILPNTRLILPKQADGLQTIKEDELQKPVQKPAESEPKTLEIIRSNKHNQVNLTYGSVEQNSQSSIDSQLTYNLYKVSYYHQFYLKNQWSFGVDFGNVFFKNIKLEMSNQNSDFRVNNLGIELDAILNKRFKILDAGISIKSSRYLINKGIVNGQAKYVDTNIHTVQANFAYKDHFLHGLSPVLSYGVVVPVSNKNLNIKKGQSISFGVIYNIDDYEVKLLKNYFTLDSKSTNDDLESLLITLSRKI